MSRAKVTPEDPRRAEIEVLVGKAAYLRGVRRDRDAWGQSSSKRAVAERMCANFWVAIVLAVVVIVRNLVPTVVARNNVDGARPPADVRFDENCAPRNASGLDWAACEADVGGSCVGGNATAYTVVDEHGATHTLNAFSPVRVGAGADRRCVWQSARRARRADCEAYCNALDASALLVPEDGAGGLGGEIRSWFGVAAARVARDLGPAYDCKTYSSVEIPVDSIKHHEYGLGWLGLYREPGTVGEGRVGSKLDRKCGWRYARGGRSVRVAMRRNTEVGSVDKHRMSFDDGRCAAILPTCVGADDSTARRGTLRYLPALLPCNREVRCLCDYPAASTPEFWDWAAAETAGDHDEVAWHAFVLLFFLSAAFLGAAVYLCCGVACCETWLDERRGTTDVMARKSRHGRRQRAVLVGLCGGHALLYVAALGVRWWPADCHRLVFDGQYLSGVFKSLPRPPTPRLQR